jgi:hypothetical protein
MLSRIHVLLFTAVSGNQLFTTLLLVMPLACFVRFCCQLRPGTDSPNGQNTYVI